MVLALSVVLASFRWRYLSKYHLNFKSSCESVILCLGVNNITPVKLGEVAKMLYLKSIYSFPVSRSLPMMVLERFFDLLMLSIAMAIVSYYLEINILFAIFILLFIALFILFISKYPKKSLSMIFNYSPKKIKKFSLESIKTVARVSKKEWFVLFSISLTLWFLYYFVHFVLFNLGSSFILTPYEILIVFVAASIGMSIPSSPGGIGVVEAGVVFALSMFGVDKESALSFAIVLRMIQYIPITLAALFIISTKKFSLKKVTNSTP